MTRFERHKYKKKHVKVGMVVEVKLPRNHWVYAFASPALQQRLYGVVREISEGRHDRTFYLNIPRRAGGGIDYAVYRRDIEPSPLEFLPLEAQTQLLLLQAMVLKMP